MKIITKEENKQEPIWEMQIAPDFNKALKILKNAQIDRPSNEQDNIPVILDEKPKKRDS